jgi:hypothetical protein
LKEGTSDVNFSEERRRSDREAIDVETVAGVRSEVVVEDFGRVLHQGLAGSSNGKCSLSNEQRRVVETPLVSEGSEEAVSVSGGGSSKSNSAVERQLGVVEINCEDDLVHSAVNNRRERNGGVGIIGSVGFSAVIAITAIAAIVASIVGVVWLA